MKKRKKVLLTELTIEKLRSYKGLENLSDEQALENIESIKALTEIALQHFHNIKRVKK